MAQLTKHALFGAAVAAAAGVPFAVHTATESKSPGLFATARPASQLRVPVGTGSRTIDGLHGTPVLEKPVEGLPVGDVSELFNFEVTPEWIHLRWPRVLANWAGPDLQTYRMPVVTGTRPEDLAGSLSYAFNSAQQVQKIEFSGVTGDARRLVAHLTQQHGFRPVATKNPGVQQFQVQSGGFAMSQLTVRNSPLVEPERPHGSQSVELILRRPEKSKLFTEARSPLDTIRWP